MREEDIILTLRYLLEAINRIDERYLFTHSKICYDLVNRGVTIQAMKYLGFNTGFREED